MFLWFLFYRITWYRKDWFGSMTRIKRKDYTGSRASSQIHHDTIAILYSPAPWIIYDTTKLLKLTKNIDWHFSHTFNMIYNFTMFNILW